jgi:hypothetical protein
MCNDITDNANSDHISDNTREKLRDIRMDVYIKLFSFFNDHTDIVMYVSSLKQRVLDKIHEFKQSKHVTKELIKIMNKVKNKLT